MLENQEIKFKAVNKGIGFYQETPKAPSIFTPKDEDHLFSSGAGSLFQGLDSSSSKFYEELTQRLEEPVLESLMHRPPAELAPLEQKSPKEKSLNKKAKNFFENFDKDSPLNRFCLPPKEVIQLDFSFSLGLYLLALVLIGIFFQAKWVPSLLQAGILFGGFHQLYVVVCRSILGWTLGEERYNLCWNSRSPWKFFLRGIFISATGFILIPIFSALSRRDLLKEYTGLYLKYNI